MTDPLADIVGLIRPRAVLWKRLDGAGDWAVRFPANSDVNFGMVTDGSCVLLGAGPPRALAAGDFVLLCGPPAFCFASGPGVPPQDGEALLADSEDNAITVGTGPGHLSPVRLVGGHFLLDPANSALLLGLVPALVHLRGTESGARRISRLLELLGDEIAADRPGAGFVLPRLVEVMLVEALRGQPVEPENPAGPENQAAAGISAEPVSSAAGIPADPASPAAGIPAASAVPAKGLLAGLADPPVATALRAMHADVARPWTVASLAAVAHQSRSVFAERFLARVGSTPIAYLLAWRMALAKDALARGRTIDEVARTVGYGSASAFATAFRRATGGTPGHYARRAGEATGSRGRHERALSR
jgi:AraC-like DNA-binding protein